MLPLSTSSTRMRHPYTMGIAIAAYSMGIATARTSMSAFHPTPSAPRETSTLYRQAVQLKICATTEIKGLGLLETVTPLLEEKELMDPSMSM